jgi:four helix bundle protein
MAIRNYRDLIAWKKAFELAAMIYGETASFPADERYGITSQLRKSAVSVPSNIAEGEGRKSQGDFRHHLSIAHGSLREIETQVLLSIAIGYLDAASGEKIVAMSSEVGRLITGLSRSLRRIVQS